MSLNITLPDLCVACSKTIPMHYFSLKEVAFCCACAAAGGYVIYKILGQIKDDQIKELKEAISSLKSEKEQQQKRINLLEEMLMGLLNEKKNAG